MVKPIVLVNGIQAPYHLAPLNYKEPRHKWIPRFFSKWYKNYWIEFTEEELIANRDMERLIELENRRHTLGVVVLEKAPGNDTPIVIIYKVTP